MLKEEASLKEENSDEEKTEVPEERAHKNEDSGLQAPALGDDSLLDATYSPTGSIDSGFREGKGVHSSTEFILDRRAQAESNRSTMSPDPDELPPLPPSSPPSSPDFRSTTFPTDPALTIPDNQMEAPEPSGSSRLSPTSSSSTHDHSETGENSQANESVAANPIISEIVEDGKPVSSSTSSLERASLEALEALDHELMSNDSLPQEESEIDSQSVSSADQDHHPEPDHSNYYAAGPRISSMKKSSDSEASSNDEGSRSSKEKHVMFVDKPPVVIEEPNDQGTQSIALSQKSDIFSKSSLSPSNRRRSMAELKSSSAMEPSDFNREPRRSSFLNSWDFRMRARPTKINPIFLRGSETADSNHALTKSSTFGELPLILSNVSVPHIEIPARKLSSPMELSSEKSKLSNLNAPVSSDRAAASKQDREPASSISTSPTLTTNSDTRPTPAPRKVTQQKHDIETLEEAIPPSPQNLKIKMKNREPEVETPPESLDHSLGEGITEKEEEIQDTETVTGNLPSSSTTSPPETPPANIPTTESSEGARIPNTAATATDHDSTLNSKLIVAEETTKLTPKSPESASQPVLTFPPAIDEKDLLKEEERKARKLRVMREINPDYKHILPVGGEDSGSSTEPSSPSLFKSSSPTQTEGPSFDMTNPNVSLSSPTNDTSTPPPKTEEALPHPEVPTLSIAVQSSSTASPSSSMQSSSEDLKTSSMITTHKPVDNLIEDKTRSRGRASLPHNLILPDTFKVQKAAVFTDEVKKMNRRSSSSQPAEEERKKVQERKSLTNRSTKFHQQFQKFEQLSASNDKHPYRSDSSSSVSSGSEKFGVNSKKAMFEQKSASAASSSNPPNNYSGPKFSSSSSVRNRMQQYSHINEPTNQIPKTAKTPADQKKINEAKLQAAKRRPRFDSNSDLVFPELTKSTHDLDDKSNGAKSSSNKSDLSRDYVGQNSDIQTASREKTYSGFEVVTGTTPKSNTKASTQPNTSNLIRSSISTRTGPSESHGSTVKVRSGPPPPLVLGSKEKNITRVSIGEPEPEATTHRPTLSLGVYSDVKPIGRPQSPGADEVPKPPRSLLVTTGLRPSTPEQKSSFAKEKDMLEECKTWLGAEAALYDIFSVNLRRNERAFEVPVGLILAGSQDFARNEIMVHRIIHKTLAEEDGRIRRGDRLLGIQGQVTDQMTPTEARLLLKSPADTLELVLGRRISEDNGEMVSNSSVSRSVHLPQEKSRRWGDAIVTDGCSDYEHSTTPTEVKLWKGAIGLGLSLQGGASSPEGDKPLTIKRIFTGGAADKCGKLRVGDRILAANGSSITHMSHMDAYKTLKYLPDGAVTLTILARI